MKRRFFFGLGAVPLAGSAAAAQKPVPEHLDKENPVLTLHRATDRALTVWNAGTTKITSKSGIEVSFTVGEDGHLYLKDFKGWRRI